MISRCFRCIRFPLYDFLVILRQARSQEGLIFSLTNFLICGAATIEAIMAPTMAMIFAASFSLVHPNLTLRCNCINILRFVKKLRNLRSLSFFCGYFFVYCGADSEAPYSAFSLSFSALIFSRTSAIICSNSFSHSSRVLAYTVCTSRLPWALVGVYLPSNR